MVKEVREAPAKIAEILRIVNLVPADTSFQEYHSTFVDAVKTDALGLFIKLREEYEIVGIDDDEQSEALAESGLRSEYDKDYEDVFERYKRHALRLCLTGLPPEFTEYVDNPIQVPSLEQLFAIFEKTYGLAVTLEHFKVTFEHFIQIIAQDFRLIEKLYLLAEMLAAERYGDAVMFHRRTYALARYITAWKKEDRDPWASRDDRAGLFLIDNVTIENRRVVFVPDVFTEAFNRVDIDRLRLCENEKCRRVFWLKRLPKKDWIGKIGCSKQCSGLLRTRQWREKTTADQRLKYEHNRWKKERKRTQNLAVNKGE